MATVISTTSTREEREHVALPCGTRMVPVWNASQLCSTAHGPLHAELCCNAFRSHAPADAEKAFFN